jgi:hypothetical protein
MMLIFVELLSTTVKITSTQVINYLAEKVFNCIIYTFTKRLQFIIDDYDLLTLQQKNIVKKYLNNFRFKNRNSLMTKCLFKISLILKAFLVNSK